MSTSFTHSVSGSGAAAGMTFSGRSNGTAPGRDVPLVIALHGGTYSSVYFDIPGYSLLDHAAAAGVPVIALDRPNYGDSSPLDAGESIILSNADVLGDAIGSIWREHGEGTAGIVLIAHSIGAAVATAIAATPQDWPLLGLAISGCLVRVPGESRAAWESLPDIPVIELPTPMKDQVMFGPAGTIAADMPAASHPSNTIVPKSELLDITGEWIEHRAEVCGRVKVPVHHRQGEFDALWVTDQSEIDAFRAGFGSATSVDSRLVHGSGHCIDFHRPSESFQLSQLSFALECAIPARA
ncbi:alpha/beta hydrolase [Leifsonia poae]|uniref:alpha/beta hydrolase n=1 Tax=Leifsonia poae TaxID=110933 RepID=UPI001CC04FC5|nr:alpha/beta hydrolase [Leifsonia poae]